MPASVLHVFSNNIADGTNTQIVRPSDWNSGHAVSFSVSATEISGLFSNANGVSFGLSNSSITASVATTYRASNDAVGLNTAQTAVTWTVNSSGISIDAGAYLTTARRSTDAVGLNTAQTAVTWTVNSSGISIDAGAYLTTARRSTDAVGLNTALTANGVAWTVNSSGLSLNVPAFLTTARGSTDAIGLNTAKTNVTWTANSSGLSFDAGGYAGTGFTTATTAGVAIVGTHNTAGLSMGVPAMLTTARGSTDAIGLNTAQTNVTWTVNSSGLSLNAGGYAGTGFTTGTTTGAWTGTNNTAGLSEVMPYATRYIWPEGNLTALTAPGNATLSIQYLILQVPVTGSRIDALMRISGGSSATANTGAFAFSAYAIIYTKNANTLSSLSSGSTQTTYTYASNSAGNTQLTGGNICPMSVPVNFNMVPGEYFIGFNMLTNTSSIGTATTALGLTLSMMGGNQIQTASNYAEINAQTATSKNLYGGMGIYSAAVTGGVAAVSLSAINQTGSALSAANIALVFRNG